MQKRIRKRSHFLAKKVKHHEQANSSTPIQSSQASQEWTHLLFRGLRLLPGESRLLSQRSCQLSGGSRVTSTFRLPLFAAAHCDLELCAVICCCLLMRDVILFAAVSCCLLPLAVVCCSSQLFSTFAAACCCLLPFAVVFCCLLLCFAACRYCFR